jgi:hypothetical protein
MSYNYKISGQEILVYKEDSAFPVRVQISYPSGKPFESLEEAKEWAESYIAYVEDDTAPAPKNDPEDEVKPRLTEEEILELLTPQPPETSTE